MFMYVHVRSCACVCVCMYISAHVYPLSVHALVLTVDLPCVAGIFIPRIDRSLVRYLGLLG